MKTSDLISLLSQDAAVRVQLGRMIGLALTAGALISAALLLSTIGMRPDMANALQTSRVLFKIIVTLAFTIVACNLVFRIGRPGAVIGLSVRLLLLPCLALAAAIALELTIVPENGWAASLVGHHAAFCVFFIPVLSLAPLTGLMLALKQGAPDNPGLAGAAAGLAAGAIAAAIYAWHCPDDSPLFVAVWYGLAIAIVICAGFTIGRRLLRW